MGEPVVGIDLGTTNSVVATVEDGVPKVIFSRQGASLTPSMVALTARGDRMVGEQARLFAEEQPEQVAFATKRFIGRRWTQELANAAKPVVPYELVSGAHGDIRVKLGSRAVPLTQISAMILGELKLDAEAHFGRPVSKAVVTVPASFDDAQRQATKEAARIAGLDVLRLVNEPTAAAVAYGLADKLQGKALVFDLGGGTFDVSILEANQGVFEVKATGGDSRLGGEDFDGAIVQWLLAQVPDGEREIVGRDKMSLQRLKVAAERAKRALSTQQEAQVTLSGLGARQDVTLNTALTRDFFEKLVIPLTDRCRFVVGQVLEQAELGPLEVSTILLVGGMTRVPAVRQMVRTLFGKEPTFHLDPDEVVALGAAIHAEELAKKSGQTLLIDVASHSLGVRVLGGGMRRLISKNTSIPVTAKEVFYPSRAGQKEARLPIFQGESDHAEENVKLGELVLRDLEVVTRGQTPLEVSFEVSSDGTLSVRAMDLSTGLAEAVRIEATTELSGAEVEHLTQEQADYAAVQVQTGQLNAEEDFKKLIEKGDRLVGALQKSATENPGPDAQMAVASVRALLDAARAAQKTKNPEQVAELSRRLTKLVGF